MNIKILEKALEKSWCKETCYYKMRDKYEGEDLAYGQCASTALVVQDYFGGKLKACKFDEENAPGHVWNEIEGVDVDLTKRQFDKDQKFGVPYYVDRKEFLDIDKAYRILKEKVEDYLIDNS
ncbi:hypothetical protein ACFL1H_00385 [Nanoarchaeota archaeon]